MMKWRIDKKPELCTGCYACVAACMQRNGLPPGCSNINVRVFETGGPPYNLACRIEYCLHCKEPSCMDSCPDSAIRLMDDGRIAVDETLCSGCGFCVEACPNGGIRVNPDSGKSVNCGLCLDEGGQPSPACVRHCPSGALALVEGWYNED